MDALASLDGILEGRTDITKAEIYLRGKPDTKLDEGYVRTLVEDDFGYTLRSFNTVKMNWTEYFKDVKR
jgi:hypothetical protein